MKIVYTDLASLFRDAWNFQQVLDDWHKILHTNVICTLLLLVTFCFVATLPVFPVVLVRPINVDVHKFAPACHADSLSCTDYPCDFLLAWNYNLLNTASIVEGPYFYTAISPASNESPAGFIKDHSCGFYRYFHTPFNSFVCVHKLEFFSPVFKPQTLTINSSQQLPTGLKVLL